MRVIFCDFDGVLRSVSSMIYNNRLKLMGLTDTPTHEALCPIACSNLEYVLETLQDVQVVVSSDWRKSRNLEALKKIFEENDILADRMIGTTPVAEDLYRGDEIQTYLKDHPEVTEFVIIDNEDGVKPYLDRLVQTNSSNGLTFTDAEKVIEMFGGKNEKEEDLKEELE